MLQPCCRCRGQQVGDAELANSRGHPLGRPLAEILLMSPACTRTATDTVALPCACSDGRELWQVPRAPHEGRFCMLFTVCICNICRLVMWPLEHVLVCLMSVCQRPKRACSDILWVAIVPCVLRTSRGSFACERARARRPRTFMVNPACMVERVA